jgi:hypothetical protein
VSCAIVLLLLKVTLTFVFLKRLVIFLTCGEECVKVAHFVSFVEVGRCDWSSFFCILRLNFVRRWMGMLLCAVCLMLLHSLCRCTSLRGRTSRTLKLRYQEHTHYIKDNDPQSAYALHIVHNRHEYGPIDKTMTLLKPLSNTSLLTPYEQYYIHSLHKEGKLISEQSPDDPNPLLLLTIDPSQALT